MATLTGVGRRSRKMESMISGARSRDLVGIFFLTCRGLSPDVVNFCVIADMQEKGPGAPGHINGLSQICQGQLHLL